MPNVKIRIELNKGRIGMPIRKLASVVQETQKFLSMMSSDLEIDLDGKEWLALNFENNSVDFDCELTGLDLDKADLTRRALRSVVTRNIIDVDLSIKIRNSTRLQFSKIVTPIDEDEVIRFGIYKNGELRPSDWHDINKKFAYELKQELPEKNSYYGEIQGTAHAFYKEDAPKRLVIRELSSRELIDCYFNFEMYAEAVEVLKEPNGVVFVEGLITENSVNGNIESIKVSDFRIAPDFDPKWIDSIAGSIPDLTGQKTTEEYLAEYRGKNVKT